MRDANPNPSISTAKKEGNAIHFGLVAVLLWSTVATGFKLGLDVLSVQQLLFLGTAISWILFLVAVLVTGQYFVKRDEILRIIGLGLLNPCAYYIVLFSAYDRLPAYIAQPLNYTWAITLAFLAVPLLKQSLSNRNLLAITISYIGVVVLLTVETNTTEHGLNWLGVSLAMASTLIWALYWILNTKCSSEPIPVMFWSFTIALPMLGFILLTTDEFPPLTTQTLFYGAWVGLLEMGITFLAWQRALRLAQNVGRISQLIFLSPVVSLGLIYLVLEEPIGLGALAGVSIILAGLWLNQRETSQTSS
ncbi:MAG: EamA family transporter [Pseudomonadales bacterium]|nr:EamA family transporter [Pseudomonadales bacterium]